MDTIQPFLDATIEYTYLDNKSLKGTTEAVNESPTLDIIKSKIWAHDIKKAVNSYNESKEAKSSLIDEFSFEIPRNLFVKDAIDPDIVDDEVVRWRGYVTEVKKSTFIARLEDLDLSGTHEIGEFPISMIPKADSNLLDIGAIFYLSLGLFSNSSGVKKRQTILKFQRLVTWTEQDYNTAIDRANRLFQEISFE